MLRIPSSQIKGSCHPAVPASQVGVGKAVGLADPKGMGRNEESGRGAKLLLVRLDHDQMRDQVSMSM